MKSLQIMRCINMRIAGIDEAGRGPVIGPMIICGVCIQDDKINLLENLKVKDSKKLSRKRREEIYKKVLENDSVEIKKIEVGPEEIDKRYSKSLSLNDLEVEKMVQIIKDLNPDVVYVDCPDVNIEKVTKIIRDKIKRPIKLIIEHKADVKYDIVSLASIIAKVTRDRLIEKLKKDFGDFGSGYPSDVKTKNYLIDWYKINRKWPPIVRKTWKTLRKLEKLFDIKQDTLEKY